MITANQVLTPKYSEDGSKHAVFRQDYSATLAVQAEKIECARIADGSYSALCYAAVAERSSETKLLEKPILKNHGSNRVNERKAFLPELSRTIRKLSYSPSTC